MGERGAPHSSLASSLRLSRFVCVLRVACSELMIRVSCILDTYCRQIDAYGLCAYLQDGHLILSIVNAYANAYACICICIPSWHLFLLVLQFPVGRLISVSVPT